MWPGGYWDSPSISTLMSSEGKSGTQELEKGAKKWLLYEERPAKTRKGGGGRAIAGKSRIKRLKIQEINEAKERARWGGARKEESKVVVNLNREKVQGVKSEGSRGIGSRCLCRKFRRRLYLVGLEGRRDLQTKKRSGKRGGGRWKGSARTVKDIQNMVTLHRGGHIPVNEQGGSVGKEKRNSVERDYTLEQDR